MLHFIFLEREITLVNYIFYSNKDIKRMEKKINEY